MKQFQIINLSETPLTSFGKEYNAGYTLAIKKGDNLQFSYGADEIMEEMGVTLSSNGRAAICSEFGTAIVPDVASNGEYESMLGFKIFGAMWEAEAMRDICNSRIHKIAEWLKLSGWCNGN